MTIYFIYKHGENIHPYLYALTDKKKLKDSFIKERKKDMFIVKEKDISKSDFFILCKTHSKYLLNRHAFETNSPFKNISEKAVIYLTTTDYEEMDVIMKEDKVILDISRFTDYEAKAFNKDLLIALNNLHYFEINKFANIHENNYFLSGVKTFDISNYRIDMFGVFLYFYGNTLDKNGLMKE